MQMSAEDFIKSQKGVTRRHEHDGSTYIIRDVWALDATKPSGFKLVTCQYATKNGAGKKVWVDCPEGVSFADIKPFEVAG